MRSHRQRLAALRRLQRVQQLARDRAAAALAQAGTAVQNAEQAQQAARTLRQELDDGFVQRVAAISRPTEFEFVEAERVGADLAISRTQRATADANRIQAARRLDIAAAERDMALTEKMVTTSRQAMARAQDRAEQMMIDDLAPTRRKPTR